MAKRLSFLKEDDGMMTELMDMDGLGEETIQCTNLFVVLLYS